MKLPNERPTRANPLSGAELRPGWCQRAGRPIYDTHRERGSSILTTTIVQGMQVVRICAINLRVEDAQLRRSLEILMEIGGSLRAPDRVPRLEPSS